MGPAFYIMAILGCGEADTACEQVAVAQAQYESVEACNAATEDTVGRHVDLSFPVVVAQCRRADAPLAQTLTPEQVDLPEPSSKPQVRHASAEVRRSRS